MLHTARSLEDTDRHDSSGRGRRALHGHRGGARSRRFRRDALRRRRPVLATGGILVLGTLLVFTLSDTFVDRIGARLSQRLFRGRVAEADWVSESAAGFRRLLRGTPLVLGSGLGSLAWFFECVAFLAVLRGFGEAGMTLLGATFTYATATLAGALSMLPGGLASIFHEGLQVGLNMPKPSSWHDSASV